MKLAPNTNQAMELIWNFPICILDMVKDQFGLFLCFKMWKSSKEENCLTSQFTVAPWDSNQNRESQGKTMRLGRSALKTVNTEGIYVKYGNRRKPLFLQMLSVDVTWKFTTTNFWIFTAQKMRFSIKDFFKICAKSAVSCTFLRIWSHLVKNL